jgi:hypothetical protein
MQLSLEGFSTGFITALIASSNRDLTPSSVLKEHSRYLTALIFLDINKPWS